MGQGWWMEPTGGGAGGGLESPRVMLWWNREALPTQCGTYGCPVGQGDSA